jgi:acyl carrier protein
MEANADCFLGGCMSDIEDRVRRLISRNLSVAEETVVPTASLIADLGADSLDTVELLMSLEDEFGIQLTDDQVASIQTVGDAVALIGKVTS